MFKKYTSLAIAILSLSMTACGPSAEEKQKTAEQQWRLQRMLADAKAFYGLEIDAGSWGRWQVISITSDPNPFSENINTVVVKLAVPRDAAGEIMSRTSEGQWRAVGFNACPPSSNPMWTIYTRDDFLELQPTVDGQVFTDVDCKRWRL